VRSMNGQAARRDKSFNKPVRLGQDGPEQRGISTQIVWRDIGDLRPFPDNPRQHPEAQILALMKSIKSAWTIPILLDEGCVILAGHGRLLAAKRLGMATVPTITILGLSPEEKRAIVISDNRHPERAIWDFGLLKQHFIGLIDSDFDVDLTGFTTGEIDLIVDGQSTVDPADNVADNIAIGPAVTQLGDIFDLGRHVLMCADSTTGESYKRLMGNDVAQMVVADPPFNVRMSGHAMGRGKIRHPDFKMASGEMSDEQFGRFLESYMHHCNAFSTEGSIHYHFIDWRHYATLTTSALKIYPEQKNLLVWNKTNAGQGSFYRSKHELIAVFKKGTARHVNNFGLGANGRYRANVLDYPSVNSMHPARRDELALHPTVKPLALVADLIRDCSRRNRIILDPFGGSGTTILAAERTGRVARVVELDPLYVDVSIRRWEKMTGIPARHRQGGSSFSDLAVNRQNAPYGDSRVETPRSTIQSPRS
jgi:DNA modification methylase